LFLFVAVRQTALPSHTRPALHHRTGACAWLCARACGRCERWKRIRERKREIWTGSRPPSKRTTTCPARHVPLTGRRGWGLALHDKPYTLNPML